MYSDNIIFKMYGDNVIFSDLQVLEEYFEDRHWRGSLGAAVARGNAVQEATGEVSAQCSFS